MIIITLVFHVFCDTIGISHRVSVALVWFLGYILVVLVPVIVTTKSISVMKIFRHLIKGRMI